MQMPVEIKSLTFSQSIWLHGEQKSFDAFLKGSFEDLQCLKANNSRTAHFSSKSFILKIKEVIQANFFSFE